MIDLECLSTAVLIRIRAERVMLTAELLESLAAAIDYIGPDRSIVLTGSGSVFAPDIPRWPGKVRAAAVKSLPGVLDALRDHPRTVVAAVNGDAIGAGYELARAADARIMSGGVLAPTSRGAERYRVQAALETGVVERSCVPAELIGIALESSRGLFGPLTLAD